MRSRSVTSLSAVVMNRRSEATGCRRARISQAELVDLELEVIDLAVGVDRLPRELGVALGEGAHRGLDHLLDARPHEQHLLAQRPSSFSYSRSVWRSAMHRSLSNFSRSDR